MAVPNYLLHVVVAANKYPSAWANAHTGNAQTEEFIRLLAADLHAIDPNVGLNGKRGNPDDISDDILALFHPPGADPSGYTVTDRTGRLMAIMDCIANAGAPNATPAWQNVGGPSPGAWVRPTAVTPPVPLPPPVPSVPYRAYPQDESTFDAIGRQIEADYKRAGRPGLDAASVRWTARILQDHLMGEAPPPHGRFLTMAESIAKHRIEWCNALGIPVI